MNKTDFRGNDYGIGDTVLYPRMSGQSCEMQEGVVVAFKPFEDERWVPNPYFDPNEDYNWKTNPLRLREKFTNHKVQIRPTKSSRFERTGNEDTKPVWIQIPENVVAAP